MNYVVVDKEQLESDLTIVADSIRAKANVTEKLEFPNGMKQAVESIQSGGNKPVEMKDITFIDHYGTYVASYTLEEAMALTELPQAPNHEDKGLTFQEWNWTLEDIKACGKKTIVGANYVTSDGKTRIYVTLNDENYLSPILRFKQTAANGVSVNWGDGNVETSATLDLYLKHKYSSVGDYVITLECTDGTFSFQSSENTLGGYLYDILLETEKSYYGQDIYYDAITKLEIGTNCTSVCGRSRNMSYVNIPKDCNLISSLNAPYICIPRGVRTNCIGNRLNNIKIISVPYVNTLNSFQYTDCGSLEYAYVYTLESAIYYQINYSCMKELHIPDVMTSIPSKRFANNCALEKVTGLSNVTSVSDSIFQNCYNLREIDIPMGITKIPINTFQNTGLKKVIIPPSVTSIDQSAFNSTRLKEITIPASVTTIGTNAFSTIPELTRVVCEAETIKFGNNAFSKSSVAYSQVCKYDFTKATVTDGVLSMTFGGPVFNNIKEGSIIMFATQEIAEVAKATTNLTTYADYIHYLGEEGVEW